MTNRRFSVRVETWNTQHGRRSRFVVRDQFGTFHGATNFPQRARVGQVANSRRG